MRITYDACLKTPTREIPVDDVKACINHFIFKPVKKQKDSELLTVVLLREKAEHLKFLKGFTKWNSVGTWMEYPNEKNVTLEVQFKDTHNEEVGKRLMKLFKALNRREIKEKTIYCRTVPIEETTL